MSTQEVFECTCDRCSQIVRVTKKGEHGFSIPKGWMKWDDRNGTVVLVCKKCDGELRRFFKLASEEMV